jgi:asparagine synthase (glutamine-hydrolysing)
MKVAGATTKRVLREAIQGIVPDEIVGRSDKIGFATAEEMWMRRESPERIRAALRDAVRESSGVLTEKALDLGEDVIGGRQAFSFLPWRMISFAAWMKRFDVALQ